MKLTRQLETEIKQLIEDSWDSYFKGDLDKWASYLAVDYKNIGSTQEEIWNSREEIRAYTEKIRSELDQAEIRTKQTQVIPMAPHIMVHEFGDIYIKTEEGWTFYAEFRVSSLLSQIDDSWKIVHQHGSYPDVRAQQGEAFGFDEMVAENKKLQKAVLERTQELELKSRELEIEASLERVRARAMAMQNSSELAELVDTVFNELTKLDFALSWCMINIIDESTMSNMVWGANQEIGEPPESYHMLFEDYRFHHEMFQAWKEKQSEWVFVLKGDEKEIYDEYLFNQTEFRRVPKPVQKEMRATKQYVASFTFSNFGGLQTVSEEHLSEESLYILSLFGKVFDLTYTRFNDLQKAEAQAREAQIEVALERVRTQSMLMQHSNELNDVSNVFHEQLHGLSIPTEFSYVWLPDEEKGEHLFWATWTEATQDSTVTQSKAVKYDLDKSEPYTAACFAAWESDELVHQVFIPKPEIEQFFSTWAELLQGATKLKAKYFPDGIYYAESYMKYGCFGINIRRLLSIEEQNILSRFTTEFERAYTRFLDLQKAEAQAREAQIEAALERVRARSMGMQKSDELKEVIQLVIEQFVHLGINVEHSGFVIDYQAKADWNLWIADPLGVPSHITFPFFDSVWGNGFNEAKEQGQDFFAVQLNFEEKNKFYQKLLKYIPGLPEEAKEFYLGCPGLAISTVLLENVGLYIENFSGTPYLDAENATLMRFGKVFQQTYTRFLDLQKAEAQAREAEIENALEKVRSRTMAMQRSEELPEAANNLFLQVQSLGIPAWSAGYCIWEKDQSSATACMSSEGVIQKPFSIPTIGEGYDFYAPLIDGESFHISELGGEEIKKHYEFMRTLPIVGEVLDGIISAGFPLPSFQIFHIVYFPQGYLMFITYEPVPQAHDIFKRFGNVFEQTYTRFLDLQKAEAQVQEARIEAGLERVRSRTIGMQQSEELKEVIQVIHDQLIHLNFKIDGAGFTLDYMQSNDWSVWFANQDQSVPSHVFIPYFEHPQFNYYSQAKEKGLDFFANTLSFEDKNSIFEYMFQFMGDYPQEERDLILNAPGFAISQVFMKNVTLWVTNYNGVPFSEEKNAILKRFAKVFEQTYVRFNDLQQAEAQAREAQIEAALERVRSRTMAMQKSDELPDAANLLFQQMELLGMSAWSAGYCIWDEDKKAITLWMSSEDVLQPPLKAPLTEDPIFIHFLEAHQRGETFFVEEMGGEELVAHYQYMRTLPGVGESLDEIIEAGHALPTFQVMHCAYFSEGFLLFITYEPVPEAHDIFKRFGQVFDQTYTRFLDLQKAEALAREAQIEAALERVRASSMAMHTSEELGEVAKVMFDQMKVLGGDLLAFGIVLCDKHENMVEQWHSLGEAGMMTPFHVPIDLDYIHRYRYDQWRAGVDLFSIEIPSDYIAQHFELMFELPTVQAVKEDLAAQGIDIVPPPWEIDYGASFKDGYLLVSSLKPFEEEKIFPRFAKVFEQAYTRFLDLQKAEAQAKEAQIEAALERVRARSMAMHQSDELADLSLELVTQVQKLGIATWFCAFNIYDDDEKGSLEWGSNGQNVFPKYRTPRERIFLEYYRAGQRGDTFLINEIGEEACPAHYEYLCSLPGVGEQLLKMKDAGLSFPTSQIDHVAYFEYGYILFITFDPAPQAHDIFKRFAKVFEQTYTRFLDLQKAEAQAREAQIELSLERIRAQAMAMNKSSDLLDIVVTMRNEFIGLGHEAHYFWHMRWLPDKYEKAMTSGDGTRIGMIMDLPRHIHGDIDLLADWEKSAEPTVVFAMDAETAVDYVDKMVNLGDFKQIDPNAPSHDDIRHIGGLTFIMAKTMHGEIGYSLPGSVPHPPKDDINTLERLAGTFDLAYRRFEDLKITEQKNRETQIELGLERVRSRGIAMHHSDELSEVVNQLFKSLAGLGFDNTVCNVSLIDSETRVTNLWTAHQTKAYLSTYHVVIPDVDHPFYDELINLYVSRKSFSIVELQSDQRQSWSKVLSEIVDYSAAPKAVRKANAKMADSNERIVLSAATMKYGMLIASGSAPISDDEADMLQRFSKVFEQTYTRFLDLQLAEKQTHQAQIEVALERVRARALAMQEPEELIEVAQVLRQEMGTLGVETLETSTIFIYDPDTRKAETWFAIRDADHPDRPLVSDHIVMDHSKTRVGREMIKFYASDDQRAAIPMTGKHRAEWVNYAYDLSKEFDGFFGDDIPDRIYHLSKFSHGAIGASSVGEISDESWDLLERAASVFSLAYSRFQDLTQARTDLHHLKEEKQRAEDALEDLKEAQSQLIHSEKMASLGELTAGIAHEIKNPLNFVNNFSEVSHELLDEMKEEMAQGNMEDATDIAQDVISNLEKIIHHGKRADGIVRGMLQHSRGATGEKESTDINVLADEYLRLAYHGLRAKDKSFNADFKAELDPDLPPIEAIPQDIGRVLLNLINNAFYAVSEKKKAAGDTYQPTVAISTKPVKGSIRVEVTDNGGGIPAHVVDKIFQPFFTTKPTGEGTGLGLSMSYDIITKGHGGDMKVETREGEGTTFIIVLPISDKT